MKRYFITGTGTDIGKTLATATIAYQLQQKGLRVAALKPVASGFDATAPQTSDAAQLLGALGRPLSELNEVCKWRFAAPVAPDQAAALEHRELAFETLLAFCNAPRNADVTLIEGAGGVLSPLTPTHSMLDWMRALASPVILVAGSYVGSVSHTLCALDVLTRCGLEVARVILSESAGSDASMEYTADAIARFGGGEISILSIPRLDLRPEMWKYAPNLIEDIA